MDDKNCSGIKNLPCLYLSDAGHAKAPKAVRACAAEAAHLAPPVEDGEWQVWRDDVTGQHYWLVVRHDAVGLMQTANGWEVVYKHDFERDHSQ